MSDAPMLPEASQGRTDRSPEQPERTPERSPAYGRRVLATVVVGLATVLLDTTIVNVAFPVLQREFGVGVASGQWILSIYVMALGIATPLAGYLADRFGTGRVYAAAIGLFAAGSLLCGLAPSLWSLVAARAIQGLGGGLALPLGTALLFAAFPPRERGRALGTFGLALVVAPALGPILGGALADLGLWRWAFLLNVPIGAIGVLMARRWLRPDRLERPAGFDWAGFALVAVGSAALLYGAAAAGDRGWSELDVLAPLAVGAIALVAFVFVELFVARAPLLDLRLFARPVFALAALGGYVGVVALFAASFLLPLYVQVLRGRSAFEAGLLLLPQAVAAGIASPLAGRMYDRYGPRPYAGLGGRRRGSCPGVGVDQRVASNRPGGRGRGACRGVGSGGGTSDRSRGSHDRRGTSGPRAVCRRWADRRRLLRAMAGRVSRRLPVDRWGCAHRGGEIGIRDAGAVTRRWRGSLTSPGGAPR
jgi:MFS family permease